MKGLPLALDHVETAQGCGLIELPRRGLTCRRAAFAGQLVRRPSSTAFLLQVNAAHDQTSKVNPVHWAEEEHAMAKTEITKLGETSPARPRDIFSAMRDEMDR